VKTKEEIRRIIKESPKVTMLEIAAKTGLTPKGVEYHIRKMREEGTLKRVGSTKSGSWEI
jgi:ATP-dependent DNA helicase RecG